MSPEYPYRGLISHTMIQVQDDAQDVKYRWRGCCVRVEANRQCEQGRKTANTSPRIALLTRPDLINSDLLMVRNHVGRQDFNHIFRTMPKHGPNWFSRPWLPLLKIHSACAYVPLFLSPIKAKVRAPQPTLRLRDSLCTTGSLAGDTLGKEGDGVYHFVREKTGASCI